MRHIFIILLTLLTNTSVESQVCVSLDNWTLSTDNGDGSCTYDVTITIDSGNGASGTAVISNNGSVIHTESGCSCNPTTFSLPVTVTCNSLLNIEVYYDAPGNGNDCSGSTGDIPLPIEWYDVKIDPKDDSNILKWATLTELNNDKFIIERSSNGIDFVSIGVLKGQGDSQVRQDYSFTDNSPPLGINYYRIKQIDFDGTFSYSLILSVSNKPNEALLIYPNPFEEQIIIIGNLDQWKILDIYGRLVLQGNTDRVDTTELPLGTYFFYGVHGTFVNLEVIVKT